jgi:hypothetical protein
LELLQSRLGSTPWSFVTTVIVQRFEASLAADLTSGQWDTRHGGLRTQPFFEGSLKLIVGRA